MSQATLRRLKLLKRLHRKERLEVASRAQILAANQAELMQAQRQQDALEAASRQVVAISADDPSAMLLLANQVSWRNRVSAELATQRNLVADAMQRVDQSGQALLAARRRAEKVAELTQQEVLRKRIQDENRDEVVMIEQYVARVWRARRDGG